MCVDTKLPCELVERVLLARAFPGFRFMAAAPRLNYGCRKSSEWEQRIPDYSEALAKLTPQQLVYLKKPLLLRRRNIYPRLSLNLHENMSRPEDTL